MSNKYKPILIVSGEPNSVFLEIFIKTLKLKKFKSPIIIITSLNILKKEMSKMNFKKKIKMINYQNLNDEKLDQNHINLINIKYNPKKKDHINRYINNSFNIAFKIIKDGFTKKMINGPINKKSFLGKKFLGVTEFISQRFKKKKFAMLIYNKELSVCPLTTHLPIKNITNQIKKKTILEKVSLINEFFQKNFGYAPKIAVTGLNPHCESINKINEDDKIVRPTVIKLKKRGLKIDGPFPADTIFLKQNRKKYNVILGMYHDQVLTPLKTLKEYDAINITLGLPFYRISPDHGPNKKMISKNLSNPLSLIRAMQFLDKK